MKPIERPTYLDPVRGSVDALSALYSELLGDLDLDRHGFGWWHGPLDAQRVALISEYTMASIAGAITSVSDAAFALQELVQYTNAHDHWQRSQIKTVKPGADISEFFKALALDSGAEKRERRVRLQREYLMYHLAQTFDRLAAIVVAVGAIEEQVIRADWRMIEKYPRRSPKQAAAGTSEQTAYVKSVRAAVLDSGPIHWLDWVDGHRNTSAHRAPKLHFVHLTKGNRQDPQRFVTLFDRQPRWADLESLVRTSDDDEGFKRLYLQEDPVEVCRELVHSLDSAVIGIVSTSAELWRRRRAEPLLLVQPKEQWPTIHGSTSNFFPGYGKVVSLAPAGEIRVSTDQGRRMRASGLFDPDFWARRDT